MTAPLCPLVLTILDTSPRGTRGVARELTRRQALGRWTPHEAATVTLRRLHSAGLVYLHGTGSQRTFRLTRRGRSELALQRALARL